MRIRFVVLLGVALAAAAACGSDDAPPTPALAGTSWVADRVFVAGSPVPIVPDTQVTIDFSSDGRVTGRTGCNNFFGTATVSGDHITIGQLGMTEIAGMTEIGCEPPLHSQESRVIGILQGADRWSIADGMLSISGSTGCNDFGGEASIAPPAISVEALDVTEEGCEPPVTDQERLILDVLLGVLPAEVVDEDGDG